ncbi:hypothetical protein GR183_02380 [Stappia sp. GBMRC 2046]|uniref:Uncharacterized protein n=1 Tax=Stappia sediminis TaxID=2692190 RepID=A0A7X3LRG7_9HYPH|nr:hypothetical protein [Stappia sediminis]MXN63739.1 hypothetical protein [Stappia sediminis]
MLSGRQTLGSIEKALAELRREEAAVNARLEKGDAEIARLREEQLAGFRELAAFRLEGERKGELERSLSTARESIAELLRNRAREIADLRAERSGMEGNIARATDERTRLASEREALADKLDEVMDRVDDRLAGDAGYIAQKEKTDTIRSTAEAAREKARQAEADRDEKGIAYESDPLFMYLWNRGFGTSAYSHTGLVRFLDRWVASLIRYHDARPNYAMLTEIPVRLDQHATDREREAQAEMDRLAEMSRLAAKEIAGEDIAGRIAALDDDIDQRSEKLEQLEHALSALVEKERVYLNGEDEGFKQAREALAASLGAESLRELWQDALATPSPEDERIISRLQEIEDRKKSLEFDISNDRSILSDIGRRRAELSRVTREFRRNGYDDWNSTFSDDNLASVLLGELIRGAITGADYWARAQRSHRRRTSRGRGVGFPDGFGLPGSMGGPTLGRRGRSGGGFSTGGSFGGSGGGFKTGRTF